MGHSEHYYNLCDGGTSLYVACSILYQKFDIVYKKAILYANTVLAWYIELSSSFCISEFCLLRYLCIVANFPVSVPLSILIKLYKHLDPYKYSKYHSAGSSGLLFEAHAFNHKIFLLAVSNILLEWTLNFVIPWVYHVRLLKLLVRLLKLDPIETKFPFSFFFFRAGCLLRNHSWFTSVIAA